MWQLLARFLSLLVGINLSTKHARLHSVSFSKKRRYFYVLFCEREIQATHATWIHNSNFCGYARDESSKICCCCDHHFNINFLCFFRIGDFNFRKLYLLYTTLFSSPCKTLIRARLCHLKKYIDVHSFPAAVAMKNVTTSAIRPHLRYLHLTL